MKPTPVAELADRLGGRSVSTGGLIATGWAWDSREVKPGDVFLATCGLRQDGHDFVPNALAAGAVAAVVERPVVGPHVEVEKLEDALALMARSFRTEFTGPVVGITGSVGKTTTKEFLSAALETLGPVLKTSGNRNTGITVPLMWTEVGPEHKSVIVEMGMRGFGQIHHLATLSQPTVGIVTNIGTSHMEMVGDLEGVARAKGELLAALPDDGFAILPADDPFLGFLSERSSAGSHTFGMSPEADCRILEYYPLGWDGSAVAGTCFGEPWSARLPCLGAHLAVNAAAAVLAARLLGVGLQIAAGAIVDADVPPLRMEVREWNGAKIILDAYNASPASVKAAIQTLGEADVPGRRFAVIGEMKEIGPIAAKAHLEIARALLDSHIDWVMLYGSYADSMASELKLGGQLGYTIHIAENLSDVESFLRLMRPGDAAVVKGSRSLELERAVPV